MSSPSQPMLVPLGERAPLLAAMHQAGVDPGAPVVLGDPPITGRDICTDIAEITLAHGKDIADVAAHMPEMLKKMGQAAAEACDKFNDPLSITQHIASSMIASVKSKEPG